MCVHAPADVHVVGGVVLRMGCCVPPCHLVAPSGSANATVWVTLRQFAPRRLIFLKNVLSSLAASLHMGSLHPAVVFIITAVFCSVPLVVLDRLKLL